MPVAPTLLERLIFFTSNQGPAPMFDLVGALGFKAIETALRLGLFEALGQDVLDPAELARRIQASERGVRFLLQALEPLGCVERTAARHGLVQTPAGGKMVDERGYYNSQMTRRWLLSSSTTAIGDLFLYFDDMLKRWGWLDQSVREGQAAHEGDDWFRQHPEGWGRYHRGMRAIARLLSPELLERIRLPAAARRLLDLGGSHALYSCRYCQAYPELSATVLDWAPAREVAEETIVEEGVDDRVEFRVGDFLRDDLGQDWDVIFLFAVARLLPPEKLGLAFKKIAEALAPGGSFVLLDQLVDELPTRFLQANAKLINLELFNSSRGDIYPVGDIARRMREAGLVPDKPIRLKRSGGQGVLVGKKGS